MVDRSAYARRCSARGLCRARPFPRPFGGHGSGWLTRACCPAHRYATHVSLCDTGFRVEMDVKPLCITFTLPSLTEITPTLRTCCLNL